jgi:high-affinity iron transporter
MLPGFVITLREGLEAALIIGIVLGSLGKIDRRDLRPVVWLGAIAAVFISILVGALLNFMGASFEGRAEAIFEGFTMLLAAGVLTWMIFWMLEQANTLSQQLEGNVQRATQAGSKYTLFLLAFVAVLREGIELGLFLTAAAYASDGRSTLIGALLGLASALIIAWILFTSLIRLDLRKFFLATGGLLILFAAGLVAHGVHEFNEVGWIPSLVEHVWDINHILDEKSGIGELLKALFGYNGNPSLSEIIAYGGYLGAVLIGIRRRNPSTNVPSDF